MKFFSKASRLIRSLSLRKKITISLIFVSFIMAIYMGISSFQVSSNTVYEMSRQLSENNFSITESMLKNYFQSINKYSTLIVRLTALRDIIRQKEFEYEKEMISDYNLDSSLHEILNLASSTDKISINFLNVYCKNGFQYSYRKNDSLPYNDYESCINYYISEGYISTGYNSPTWCDVVKTIDITGRETISIINVRLLYDEITLEERGVLVTGINENDLTNIYSSYSDKAIIINNNGQIVSHLDKSLVGKQYSNENIYQKIIESNKYKDTLNIENNGESQLVTFQKIADNDFFFIVPFDLYSGTEVAQSKAFGLNILVLVLIGFFISIVFSLIISRGLSASILSLKKTVQSVYNGDLNARFRSANIDEVTYLGNMFNQMLDEINTFYEKQIEHENANKTLELKLLQSHINPHLLYNTLDSILWYLENEDTSQAKELIESLSDFFKVSLSFGNSLIPIKKELELINSYINIQNIASNKNITIKVFAAKKVLDMQIIKLSIQPIIENAIIHGFTGYRNDGTVTISISQLKSGNIEIVIEDNGIGITKEELENINNLLQSSLIDISSQHFGLYNIQRRIRTLYGNEYGLVLKSEVGNYTRVIMTINSSPLRQEDN